MTDVVVDGVQAMTPAPAVRAFEGAPVCRSVFGQECFGSATTAVRVESVSGTGLAGAAVLLGLVALGEARLERHGYAGGLGQERPRPASQLIQAPLTDRDQGDELPQDSGWDISERDDDSTSSSKGENGTKPMNPWDFRTSSPPG